MDGQSGTLKEEVENAGEDGELLSLIPVAAVVNDIKLAPSKGSLLELIWMEDLVLKRKRWRMQGKIGNFHLFPVAAVVNDVKLTPSKGSLLEHSIGLALISKSIVSPIDKAKSLSFRKHDEDSYLMLDSESDWEGPLQIEPETENAARIWCYEMVARTWVVYCFQEYCLVLARTMDNNERNIKLEAKIKISVEYTLRPPHFAVNLYTASVGDSSF